MSVSAIVHLLTQEIGLDPASVGLSLVEHSIRRQMKRRGFEDDLVYLQALQDVEERRLLIEEMVVKETWFFRDYEPFIALRLYLSQVWLPQHAGQVLRVLSIPCATGEEPYSIAMTLLDLKLSRGQFLIDAVDVSEKALEAARVGLYTGHSLRGKPISLMPRYLENTERGYQVIEPLRDAVQFWQGNLLDPDLVFPNAPYDIIFCRNLLIYFDRASKERAITRLHQLLPENGILFVGHAETISLPSTWFSKLDYPLAFAYQKSDLKQRVAEAVSWQPRPAPTRPQRVVVPEQAPKVLQGLRENTADLLQEAQQLADQGLLEEAIVCCERCLRDQPDLARAYYLLGVIYQAQGHDLLADSYLRKAVYLEPEYHEALLQLALLAHHRGDPSGAELYERRASRVLKRREEADQSGVASR